MKKFQKKNKAQNQKETKQNQKTSSKEKQTEIRNKKQLINRSHFSTKFCFPSFTNVQQKGKK